MPPCVPAVFRSSTYFIAFALLCLLTGGLTGCKNSGNKNAPQTDLSGQLEINGRINTFPLCVVISDNLSGSDFPADMKVLCGFSKSACKTLPDAGILRSGADVYYKYNCFDDLQLPSEQDEAGITRAVEQQSGTYFAKTTLKSYDSLQMPNQPDWNVQDFPSVYIGNTSDSVFFYSNQPAPQATIQVKDRAYPVYTNAAELRAQIDKLICKGYTKVAVFYNAMPGAAPEPKPASLFAVRGTRAGDSCVETARYEKLHDGSGGFLLGKLLKTNSTSCGFENSSLATAAEPPVQKPAETRARPAGKPFEPALGEEFDNPVAPAKKDNQCFRTGEPVCEQDDSKNYTGRRVQYCYNRTGQVVRTIVVSKCEADCRCF